MQERDRTGYGRQGIRIAEQVLEAVAIEIGETRVAKDTRAGNQVSESHVCQDPRRIGAAQP